jgi:hypothetical protein
MDEGDYVTNGKNITWEHASECAVDAFAKLNSGAVHGQFAQLNALESQSEKISTLAGQDTTSTICGTNHNSANRVREL